MSNTGDPHAPAPSPWSRDAAPGPGQPSWPSYPSAGEPTPPYAGGIYGSVPPAPTEPDPYAPESYGQQPNRPTPVPYPADPYPPSAGGYGTYKVTQPPHPQAVLALVLGIVGVSTSFMCVGGLIGIPALIISQKVKREIDATPGRYTGRGMASAGIVTGILSIVIMALMVVFFGIGAATDYH